MPPDERVVPVAAEVEVADEETEELDTRGGGAGLAVPVSVLVPVLAPVLAVVEVALPVRLVVPVVAALPLLLLLPVRAPAGVPVPTEPVLVAEPVAVTDEAVIEDSEDMEEEEESRRSKDEDEPLSNQSVLELLDSSSWLVPRVTASSTTRTMSSKRSKTDDGRDMAE